MNFMHAYCISIHKSQGSEFPIVVLPVISSYHRMLRKNLLYTAITRSKESLIICGDSSALCVELPPSIRISVILR